MADKHAYILEGNLTRGVITLSTPIIFAMFFHSLLNLVDTFWVGKISATAVAAVSVSFPVTFMIIALAAGISTGATALVARFVGAKDYNNASKVAKNALILGIAFSAIIMLVGLLFNSEIFKFLGVSGELHSLAVQYTRIIFYGTFFYVLMFTLGSIIRGEGDTKTTMWVGVSINILNMIIDPIFIFTLGWGVQGAAIATIVSTAVGMIAYLYHFWRGKSIVKLVFNKLEYSAKYIYEILYIGVPASLRNITNAIGIFFTIKIIASYGPEVVAAYGIAFRVETFGILPVMAIAISTVTMVGQNIGANKLQRAKRSGWISVAIGSASMAGFGVIVWIFAAPIIQIFNTESEVVFHGTQILKIKAPAFFVAAIIMTLSSAFVAFGKSHYGFIITAFRVSLMLALAYWFNSIWGIIGVWWAIVFSGIFSALLSIVWYKLYQPNEALNNS